MRGPQRIAGRLFCRGDVFDGRCFYVGLFALFIGVIQKLVDDTSALLLLNLSLLLSRHTKRREFITVVGGGAAVWPFAVRAQQSKVPTIGVLVVGVPGSETFWRLFQEALHDLGYVGGQTVRFEFRSDQGR
jgi:hypothetical protein